MLLEEERGEEKMVVHLICDRGMPWESKISDRICSIWQKSSGKDYSHSQESG